MKKRKKKVSSLQQQKLNQARHKNEFFHRLRKLCNTLGIPQVYQAITADELDHLYFLRFQSIRVIPAAGCIVPENVIKTAKVVADYFVKAQKVPVLKDRSLAISLHDYFTVFVTLTIFADRLRDKPPHPKHTIIIDAFEPFGYPDNELFDEAAIILRDTFHIIQNFESDLRQRIYWMVNTRPTEYCGKGGMYSFLEVHSDVPERRSFMIDGHSRPAFRIGWGEWHDKVCFVYASVTPEQLGIRMHSKDLLLPVYIQSHAIQRLFERLDTIIPGLIFLYLNNTVKFHLKVQRDSHGNILFEMLLGDHKVGYLLADIIDSAVVIRTFLFLTQSGTPEGEKLAELTGLNKTDKTYLEMDRLSTFLESDIHKNEKLKQLFIDAGCESLFLLDRDKFNIKIDIREKPMAERIIDYLGLNQKDDSEEDFEEFETEDDSEPNGEKESGCD